MNECVEPYTHDFRKHNEYRHNETGQELKMEKCVICGIVRTGDSTK